ncbi:MAG: hypothetical protein RLY43_2188 [Bacteroidota bacterium]|jgi:hypothetical protein
MTKSKINQRGRGCYETLEMFKRFFGRDFEEMYGVIAGIMNNGFPGVYDLSKYNPKYHGLINMNTHTVILQKSGHTYILEIKQIK